MKVLQGKLEQRESCSEFNMEKMVLKRFLQDTSVSRAICGHRNLEMREVSMTMQSPCMSEATEISEAVGKEQTVLCGAPIIVFKS